MPCNLEVFHQNLFARLAVISRSKIRYQTDDSEFDQKYRIELRSEKDKRILQGKGYRKLVSGLEPLSILVLAPSGIHWALEINSESQFDFQRLRDRIDRLIEMAKESSRDHK